MNDTIIDPVTTPTPETPATVTAPTPEVAPTEAPVTPVATV